MGIDVNVVVLVVVSCLPLLLSPPLESQARSTFLNHHLE